MAREVKVRVTDLRKGDLVVQGIPGQVYDVRPAPYPKKPGNLQVSTTQGGTDRWRQYRPTAWVLIRIEDQ